MAEETNGKSVSETKSNPSIIHYIFVFIAAITMVVLLIWFSYQAINILLLLFAAVLFAVFLQAAASWLSGKIHLRYGWALLGVILVLLFLLAGGIIAMVPLIASQVEEMSETLPEAAGQFRRELQQYQWAQPFLGQVDPYLESVERGEFPQEQMENLGPNGEQEQQNQNQNQEQEQEQDSDMGTNWVRKGLGIFATALSALGALLVIVLLGIYMAAEPEPYRNGILRLIPLPRRERARQVLDRLAYTYRWWLLGQVVSMTVLGTLTTVGLWIIGIPLALLLGLFAALMTFIPNLGPVIAAVPAILLALTQGGTETIAVIILYILLQNIEGYAITPLIHRRAIQVPPAVIIGTQLLMAVTIGFLGVVLALPLLATILVLVQMLYVEDTLNDSLEKAP
jgi:predicted PurR-regulated permease PerM